MDGGPRDGAPAAVRTGAFFNAWLLDAPDQASAKQCSHPPPSFPSAVTLSIPVSAM